MHELQADDRADGREQLHVARAHRADDVQHEHHAEGEQAAADARKQSVPAADERVDEEAADEAGEHVGVGDAAVAHVVVGDDECRAGREALRPPM